MNNNEQLWTEWVTREVHTRMDFDPSGRKHTTCPNPAHQDNNPSFRVDFGKFPNTGWPVCTCGKLDWHEVALWVGAPTWEQYKQDHKPQQRHPVQDSNRPQTFAEYALSHGVSPQVLNKKYGWGPVTHAGRPAVGFMTDSGMRYRFLDGKSPKYMSEKGYKPCLYGIGSGLLQIVADTNLLIIANGEISVVAAREHGLPAICLTSGEKGAWPEEELAQLIGVFRDISIRIAFDCDDAGRKAGLSLAKQFNDYGFHDVFAVDLMLGDKGDVADFCVLHDENVLEEFRGLPLLTAAQVENDSRTAPKITAAQRYPGLNPNHILYEGREIVVINAEARDQIPDVSWVVEGEIPDRGITVLYGPSGVGKSFYVIAQACEIAQQHRVFYDAGEGESGVRARLDAWSIHHKKSVKNLDLGLGAIHLMDDEDFETWMSWARDQEYKLVIFDTLNSVSIGIDDNNGREVSIFLERCRRLALENNCAVMLIHHTNKAGIEFRGSQRIKDKADAMIAVVDDDDMILIESTKMKDKEPFPTKMYTRLQIELGRNDQYGKPLVTPVLVPGIREEQDANSVNEVEALTPKQRKVLEAIALPIFEHGCQPAELKELLPDIHTKSLPRILSRLKQFDLLQQDALRSPYVLTPKARAMLGMPIPQTNDEEPKVAKIKPMPKQVRKPATVPDSMFDDEDISAATDPANISYFGGI